MAFCNVVPSILRISQSETQAPQQGLELSDRGVVGHVDLYGLSMFILENQLDIGYATIC